MVSNWNVYRWLDPTSATPPQQEQFLCLLWLSIVEHFTLVEHLAQKDLSKREKTQPSQNPPSLQRDLSTLKIKLSSTGTVSHLEDPGSILKTNRPKDDKVVFSTTEIEQQLQGAKFDFRDPTTFAVRLDYIFLS